MCAQFALTEPITPTICMYLMYILQNRYRLQYIMYSVQFNVLQKIAMTKLLRPVCHIMYYVYTMYRLQNGLNIFIAQCFHHCIAYVYF